MKKISLALLVCLSHCTPSQTQDRNDLFGATILVAATAVTGVTLWRITAQDDMTILNKINSFLMTHEENLQKYNQHFNTQTTYGEKETQLVEILLHKLQYQDQYIFEQELQRDLSSNKKIIQSLKDSIWFRSFFSTAIAELYEKLTALEANIIALQSYFTNHASFFKGWNLYKEYLLFRSMESQNIDDFIYSIKGHYLLQKGYPLILFTNKIINDLQWIENLKKGVYPTLERHLQEIKAFATRSCVLIQCHSLYKDELKMQYEDQERQRLYDLAHVEMLKAQALINSARAAQQQADIATKNVKIEQERLKLEQEENERKKIEARIEELKRLGYSPEEIQAQLYLDGFTATLLHLFFG